MKDRKGSVVVAIGTTDEDDDVTSITPMDQALQEAGLETTGVRYAYWAWVNKEGLVEEFAKRARA